MNAALPCQTILIKSRVAHSHSHSKPFCIPVRCLHRKSCGPRMYIGDRNDGFWFTHCGWLGVYVSYLPCYVSDFPHLFGGSHTVTAQSISLQPNTSTCFHLLIRKSVLLFLVSVPSSSLPYFLPHFHFLFLVPGTRRSIWNRERQCASINFLLTDSFHTSLSPVWYHFGAPVQIPH